VCIGHRIDTKGVLAMILRWSDHPDDSAARVSKVMGVEQERREYSGTWLKYCDRNRIRDELFRMKGIVRVERIMGHDWGDDGRPVAQVRWKHGEESEGIVVALAMERVTDSNKLKAEWAAYCDRIGVTDEGFRQGYVDQNHRKPKQKAQKKERGGGGKRKRRRPG
jgi:hypothetical protein